MKSLKHWINGDASRMLVVINVAVFLLYSIPGVLFTLSGNPYVIDMVLRYVELPLLWSNWVIRPWTLFTYQFLHSGPLHLLFNVLWLYWFGALLKEYLGNRRVWISYLGGGLFGGILAMATFSLLPLFQDLAPNSLLIGASGAVLALVTATATLLPEYEISILLIGGVRLKYLAIFIVLLDFLSLGNFSNPGGHLAHLGGALWGYLFVKSLYSQKFDFDAWIERTFVRKAPPRAVVKKSSIKVVYQAPAKARGVEVNHQPSQDEVDLILDKINESGYESLTPFEKEILFKASHTDD